MAEPMVSILLASLRPQQLSRCLASIRRWTADISFETVIVSPFEPEPSADIVHIRETEPQGIYRAIALAYERARGGYIVHIPDDCRATPRWAANMIAFMRPHDHEIFEGNFRHFDVTGERAEPGYYGRLFAPFMCIRKEAAERTGGLMDCSYRSFFGDPDLSLRVWHGGGRVETCPDAWVYHADCSDDVHRRSYDSHFLHDREVFIRKWHRIYARPGDTRDFFASEPVSDQPRTRELPPEQCTKIYVSMRRGDWDAVRRLVACPDSGCCAYPEGMPVLYNLAREMLKAAGTPRETLHLVV